MRGTYHYFQEAVQRLRYLYKTTRSHLVTSMSNDTTIDPGILPRLLLLLLRIKDFDKNDKELLESMFPGTMLPVLKIRAPSSDWIESMGTLHNILSDKQRLF